MKTDVRVLLCLGPAVRVLSIQSLGKGPQKLLMYVLIRE